MSFSRKKELTMNRIERGMDLANPNPNCLSSIFAFVESNAKKINLLKKELGETTLVSLLTKVNLSCIKTIHESGEFIVQDGNHLMMTTKTASPNLMVHEKSIISYNISSMGLVFLFYNQFCVTSSPKHQIFRIIT